MIMTMIMTISVGDTESPSSFYSAYATRIVYGSYFKTFRLTRLSYMLSFSVVVLTLLEV